MLIGIFNSGGTTAIMNMNTQCNISPTREQALIAVWPFFCPEPSLSSSRDSECSVRNADDGSPLSKQQVDRISGKITVNVSLDWRKCR